MGIHIRRGNGLRQHRIPWKPTKALVRKGEIKTPRREGQPEVCVGLRRLGHFILY
jgi:hypothetical protein